MIRIQITDGNGFAFSNRVSFIQVRDHAASARELARKVRAAMKVAPVLVNDRADVAVACGAAGVHLRSHAVSPTAFRKLGDLIVSVSCHSAEDVARAEHEGADFAVLAPIFSPLSKQDDRPPLGLDALAQICRSRRIPVIALGGITAENAAVCQRVGAAGVAGISLYSKLSCGSTSV